MSAQQWQRLGSLAALTTGAFLIMPLVLPYIAPFLGTDDPRIGIPVFILHLVLYFGATLALQVRLQPDLGRLGWIMGAVVLLSMSVSGLSELFFFWELALMVPLTYVLAEVGYVGGLIYSVSALLYGLLALKSRLGPIRNILPLCTYGISALAALAWAFIPLTGVSILSSTFSLYGTVFPVLSGIGWIAIGIFLWRSNWQHEQQASPVISPQA